MPGHHRIRMHHPDAYSDRFVANILFLIFRYMGTLFLFEFEKSSVSIATVMQCPHSCAPSFSFFLLIFLKQQASHPCVKCKRNLSTFTRQLSYNKRHRESLFVKPFSVHSC